MRSNNAIAYANTPDLFIHAYKTTNTINTVFGENTVWNAIDENRGLYSTTSLNTSTGYWTAPVDGFYTFRLMTQMFQPSVDNVWHSYLYVNDIQVGSTQVDRGGVVDIISLPVYGESFMEAGQRMNSFSFIGGGGSVTLIGGKTATYVYIKGWFA